LPLAQLEKVSVATVRLQNGKNVSMDEVFAIADEALQEDGAPKEEGAAELFDPKSLFRQSWNAQAKYASTLWKEQQRHPDRRATGAGVRYHPVHIRWALKLYQQSRSAYRSCMELMILPSERCAFLPLWFNPARYLFLTRACDASPPGRFASTGTGRPMRPG